MSRYRTHLYFVVLALAVVLGAAVLAACGDSGGGATASPTASATASSSASSDPVVLLVDGLPVRRSAVDAVRAEFRLGGTADSEARAEKEAVRRELTRLEAERLGVVADPAEIDSRRSAMVTQLGGEQALASALARVPITEEQLRSGLTDGVLREAVQDAKYEHVTATTASARDYYDAHRSAFHQTASAHLWTIQVAAERVAESALGRLRDGHPWEEVARQFSTDPESKAAGGDVGTVALSSLPAPLRKTVEKTPDGQIGGPVQGPGGWYLLKTTGRSATGIPPFSKVKQEIVKELTTRKRFAALEAWLDAAVAKATVTRP
jgi:parvulin-like peptidyl-prolyl isomerase